MAITKKLFVRIGRPSARRLPHLEIWSLQGRCRGRPARRSPPRLLSANLRVKMKRLLACSMCIRVRPLQPTPRMNRRALAAALVAADDDLPRSRMGRETGTASTSGNVTTYRDRMGREVGTAERHREALLKSLPLRNLGKRPAKPALNRGRFQPACPRAHSPPP